MNTAEIKLFRQSRIDPRGQMVLDVFIQGYSKRSWELRGTWEHSDCDIVETAILESEPYLFSSIWQLFDHCYDGSHAFVARRYSPAMFGMPLFPPKPQYYGHTASELAQSIHEHCKQLKTR